MKSWNIDLHVRVFILDFSSIWMGIVVSFVLRIDEWYCSHAERIYELGCFSNANGTTLPNIPEIPPFFHHPVHLTPGCKTIMDLSSHSHFFLLSLKSFLYKKYQFFQNLFLFTNFPFFLVMNGNWWIFSSFESSLF